MKFDEAKEKCCETLPAVFFLIFTFITCFGVISTCVAQLIVNRELFFYTSNVYSSILIFTSISLFYFAFDAVLNENSFQLFGFVFISFGMSARVTYQLIKIPGSASDPIFYLFLIPSIFVYASQIGFLIAVIPVYKKFGWKAYYKIGSSPELINSYKFYQMFVTMLKLDFEATITLFIMIILIASYDNYFLLIGFGIGFLFTVVLTPFGHYFGVRKEFRLVQIIYLVLSLALPIFLIYSMVTVWLYPADRFNGLVPVSEYTEVQIILTIICAVAVLIRLILIILGIFCLFQFNNGLKQVFDKEWYLVPDFIINLFSKNKEDDAFSNMYGDLDNMK
eukprot:gene11474-4638_t